MSELDRLLDAAREAEPDPLDDSEMGAMVRAARRGADRISLVDRALQQARRAEPDPLTEPELRAMARRAAMTGRARHRRWTRRRVLLTSGLAAALAAAAVTLMVSRSEEPGAPGSGVADAEVAVPSERTDFELPTGDRIVAASGARFEVDLPDPRARSVRLGGGSMLFDVRPIEGGRFTVSTSNAEVVVLGTVFSVRATDRSTTVWVYEGAVQVRAGDGPREVHAGGVLHLGAGEAEPDALAAEGRDAANARRATAERVVGERAAAEQTAVEQVAAEQVAAERHALERVSAERVAVERTVLEQPPSPMAGGWPPSSPPGPAPPPPAPELTAADVRALIGSGEIERALAAAERAIGRGETDPFRMLEGDALRALGRFEEAADAYRQAADELPSPRRQQAGFLEARVRVAQLDDPTGALRALRGAEVNATDSVLRERGMALEAQLLARTGRRAEAADVAAAYLRDYPDGPDAEVMRAYR